MENDKFAGDVVNGSTRIWLRQDNPPEAKGGPIMEAVERQRSVRLFKALVSCVLLLASGQRTQAKSVYAIINNEQYQLGAYEV